MRTHTTHAREKAKKKKTWCGAKYKGIGLLYRKNELPRELWIAYLERKFAKTKVTLQKKLGVRPDGWSDKIIRD